MTRDFVDELLGEIRQRFYCECGDRTFYAQRRSLLKAIAWPAGWLRHHGFSSEVTRAAYRRLIVTVIEDVARHGRASEDPRVGAAGPQLGESAFFPAYLMKCLQDHCRKNTEAVLYDFKALRNRVDFGAMVTALKTAPGAAGPSLVDELARAHELLAAPKRRPAAGRARPEGDAQLALL